MRIPEGDFNKLLLNPHVKVRGELPEIKEKKGKKRVDSKNVIIDGIEFDSIAEGGIYWEYKIDREIEILELQPYFELLPEFKRFGKTYQAIGYTSDFRIREKGEIWIVEVKSTATIKANSKSYPMRRKLFLSQNPDLRFREIIVDGKKRTEKTY